MTVDDFFDEFDVDPDMRTNFGFAAILADREKYKDMSDEEFSTVYNEYKENLKEGEN